ncbi:MAG: hypothetical protein ACYC9J_13940 [Sulfuricaulis sp.]
MSLTSFLEVPDVKEKFRQEFKVSKLAVQKELLAAPLSRRYSLIGTAFDYLLRFWLQYHNKNAIRQPWVALYALDTLHRRGPHDLVYDLDEGKLYTTAGQRVESSKDLILETAERLFSEACAEHERYIATGDMTDGLIKAAVHLAQLDVIFRADYIDPDLGKTHKEDVQDLRNLITLVNPNLFRTKQLCLLNPTFGKASSLIGGADADLLLDDMLVDIKTTKFFRLEPDAFFQLIGYYTLYMLGGIADLAPKPEITKVGIYFSRHAHLEVFELENILNQETFPKFIAWFSDRATRFSETVQ